MIISFNSDKKFIEDCNVLIDEWTNKTYFFSFDRIFYKMHMFDCFEVGSYDIKIGWNQGKITKDTKFKEFKENQEADKYFLELLNQEIKKHK